MPSSHGGGSSGGGGHSSGGSGGGGFSSGSGGGRDGGRPRISRNSFAGGSYYEYYGRHGRRRGFYYEGWPQRQPLGNQILGIVIIIFFFMTFLGNKLDGISLPVKMSENKLIFTCDYYEDEIGIVRNGNTFTEPLKKFYKKTGVQPYVYMFPSEEFPETYGELNNNSLERYAYKLYVNKFDDEGHFLIVYTQNQSGDTWYWCDMSGDDTGGVINDTFWKEFQSDMQKYLNIDTVTPDEAICKTFENSLGYALSWKGMVKYLPYAVLLLFVMAVFIVPQIIYIRNSMMVNGYMDYQKKRLENFKSGTGEDNDDSEGSYKKYL